MIFFMPKLGYNATSGVSTKFCTKEPQLKYCLDSIFVFFRYLVCVITSENSPTMKTLFLLFTVLCASLDAAHAQDKAKLDILKQELTKLPPEGRSFASDTLRVMVLCEMGKEYPDIKLSFSYLNEALTLAKQSKWLKGQILVLTNLGIKTKKKGNMFRAADYLYEALSLSEKNDNEKQTELIKRHLGDTYVWINDIPKALSYYKEAKILAHKLNNNEEEWLCVNNTGLAYYQLKDYPRCIEYFQRCLALNKQFHILRFDAYANANLGMIYREIDDNINALKHLNLALPIYDSLGKSYTAYKAIPYLDIAQVYESQKKYSEAIKIAQKALTLNGSEHTITSYKANLVLYRIHKKMGQDKQALNYYEVYDSQKDSLDSQSFTERIESLKFEYDNQKSKTEIELLNKEKEQKEYINNALIIGLFLFLLFAGTLFWSNLKLRKQKKQIEFQQEKILNVQNQLQILNQNLEERVNLRTEELMNANKALKQKNQEIEKALLRGQKIERKRVANELHDNLGSLISGIKWRLEALNIQESNERERTVYESVYSMMKNAYDEVRNISHNLIPTDLEQKGLVVALKKWVSDIYDSGRLNIQIEATQLLISPKMEFELYNICLELINNILKHANATQAFIRIEQAHGVVLVEVNDNGKGIVIDINSKNNGMGIKSIEERVDSMGGKLKITSLPMKETKVIIILPKEKIVGEATL